MCVLSETSQYTADTQAGYCRECEFVAFKIGRYLNYIFAFKFVALWTFVFMCPQWVDAFSVTLLAMLTVAYASFLVVGRAVVSDEAMPQQEENRGEN